MEEEVAVPLPHVLIFPLPLQGHVNSMLKLAELVAQAGLQITFLNSHYNHNRLLRFTDLHTRFASRFSGLFKFQTISDGLPPNHPRSADFLKDMFDSINSITKPLFKDLLISLCSKSDRSPVTCVIADGIMTFTMDIAQDLGIPIIAFRTISACSFWSYFCLPKLIEAGELPFKDDDMDKSITCLPGMESFLRRRDLPSFCRVKDLSDPVLQRVIRETHKATQASGLILNTFEDLEEQMLSQIRSHFSKVYTVGPLHGLLKYSQHKDSSPSESSSNNLWEEDKNCMIWLDSKPLKSVIYVSFGSLTIVNRNELLEFWYGLINSGKPFLWVVRPNSITEKETEVQIPTELLEGTKERGCIVEWVPQEEVLRHKAIGGFLTHSGWNSTLESLYVGVPMICWPYFADQQINSRFVSDVWKVGLDMKDTCDRRNVEKMVRDLMEGKRDELRKSADKIAEMGRRSISKGGSSDCNLNNLINHIRSLSVGLPLIN